MFQLNNYFLFRKEKDGYIFFNYKTYECFFLNETAYNVIKAGYCASNTSKIAKKLKLREDSLTQFIKDLHLCGIIKSSDGEVFEGKGKIVEKIPKIYVDLRAPIRVTWLITNRCNLSCKHCYVRSSPSSKSNELPFTQVKNILRKLSNAGVFIIYFSGGEPFTRDDFIEILKTASDLGLKIGISTNGTLLTEDIIKKLTNLDVVKVQVSLDGATKHTHEFIRGSHTFERTINAIKRLVENNIDTGITFVCHKGNMLELGDLIHLAVKLKVKGVKISPLMAWGRAKKFLYDYIPPFEFRAVLTEEALSLSKNVGIKLLDELHIDVGMPEEDSYGCPLVMGIAILPNADAIPCEVFAEKYDRDVILGNLINQTVEEIWDSHKAKRFRDAATVSNKINCKNCSLLRICGSYCIAEMYLNYSSLVPPNEYFRKCKVIWKK